MWNYFFLFFLFLLRSARERKKDGKWALLRYWNSYEQSHREQTITAYFYFILFSALWKPRTNVSCVVFFFFSFLVRSLKFVDFFYLVLMSSFVRSLPLKMCFELRLSLCSMWFFPFKCVFAIVWNEIRWNFSCTYTIRIEKFWLVQRISEQNVFFLSFFLFLSRKKVLHFERHFSLL